MTYKPNPIDVSGMRLPRKLRQLVEEIAENNHELWAQKRMAEGWKYGKMRNDPKKTHPDLVSFHALPETEKEYDYIPAIDSLKLIIALGYRIEGLSEDSGSIIREFTQKARKEAIKRLKGPDKIEIPTLLDYWNYLATDRWSGSPEIYELLGDRFLQMGSPLLAYDVVETGLKYWEKNVRLRQLKGLALARSGAIEKANNILRQLYDEKKKEKRRLDGETLGLLARTYKDLSFLTKSNKRKKEELRLANGHYFEAYQQSIADKRKGWLDDAIYNGINAASTAFLLGQSPQAESVARRVQGICLRKLRRNKKNYWALVSLGEAELLLGNIEKAEEWYEKAVMVRKNSYGDLNATRRQARILLKHMGKEESLLDSCFNIPTVAVFAGQVLDQAGQFNHRSRQSILRQVRKEIRSRLDKCNAKIGYASVACDSDIIFMEEMLKRKGELYVLLPYNPEDLMGTKGGIALRPSCKKRLQNVLQHAVEVTIANQNRSSANEATYQYLSLIKNGLARLRAETLDTEIIPVTVSADRTGDEPGGIKSFMKYWQAYGLKTEIIDLEDLSKTKTNEHEKRSAGKPKTESFSQEIKAMLFADVVGYSGIPDERVPDFVNHFMGLIAGIISSTPFKPLTMNTWGDALYFVFPSVKEAGNCALRIKRHIYRTNWKKKGLPKGLNLRISLHAGPVFHCKDPVTKRYKYTGSHVSRAARIEPITPPGEIYATQEFAALATTQGIKDFLCEYAGKVPLPKEKNIIPLYFVR